MKERWVVAVIDEGYINFHLTENKEAFLSMEAAANKGDEEAMDRFYNDGLDSQFVNEDGLEGVTVLGLVQFNAY